MCSFHVAPKIQARTTGRIAEKVDNVLTDTLLGIDAETFEEAAELRRGRETSNEIVGYGRDGIVAAQTLVQTWLLLRIELDRASHEKRHQSQIHHYPQTMVHTHSWIEDLAQPPKRTYGVTADLDEPGEA